jgi:ornithine cyclodeaminase/alanine dehydrogenase-like protein (mu-crystallin family)
MSDEHVLVLDNDDVEEVLTMDRVVGELEGAYRDLGNGEAINAPRVDTLVPTPGPGTYYGFKTMVGCVPRIGTMALRINSDIITWPERDGKRRREKVPAAPGERYVGDVFLWDTATGAPFARMPDGYIQRMRVGGCNGVAADYLARDDASTVGLLGAGWQAGGQLLALNEVRDLERVDVYSPTPESREGFAAEFDERLDADVRAVGSAEEAVDGKDIIDAATNSLDPVIDPDWLEPGVHVTGVKKQEFTAECFERADVTAMHSVEQRMQENVVLAGDVGGTPETEGGWWTDDSLPLWEDVGSLGEVVAGVEGAPERTSDDQITLFMNNIGLGIQFAAVGHAVFQMAAERELGEIEAVDRYTQEYHP